jgi:hypothetical protein
MSGIVIQVSSEASHEETALHYLPWGTRSLRLEVWNPDGLEFYLRPQVYDPAGAFKAGFADGANGKELIVSWGGGSEPGVKVTRKHQYAYFDVTHCGPHLAEAYTLTFVRFDPQQKAISPAGQVQFTCPLPGASLPGLLQPTWQGQPGSPQRSLHFQLYGGAAHPAVFEYLPRWWPPASFKTRRSAPPGDVWLAFASPNDADKMDILTAWSQAPGAEPAAWFTVRGQNLRPLVDAGRITANLFHFVRFQGTVSECSYWVLRLWFFWLDTAPAAPGEISSLGAKEEIPDSERLDLLFDDALELKFIGTDQHYLEMWAPVGDVPAGTELGAQLGIGHPKELDEALHSAAVGVSLTANLVISQAHFRLSQLIASLPGVTRKPAGNPMNNLLTRLEKEFQDAQSAAVQFGVGDLAGTHTPFLEKLTFPSDLISGDVREVPQA